MVLRILNPSRELVPSGQPCASCIFSPSGVPCTRKNASAFACRPIGSLPLKEGTPTPPFVESQNSFDANVEAVISNRYSPQAVNHVSAIANNPIGLPPLNDDNSTCFVESPCSSGIPGIDDDAPIDPDAMDNDGDGAPIDPGAMDSNGGDCCCR